jgi:uncharacterized membrane protein YuzA (DUF378 family)
MAEKMKPIDYLAIVLLTIGGIHVGTVQWFGFDIAKFVSFGMMWLEVTIKSLIGLAGIWSLIFLIKQATKK